MCNVGLLNSAIFSINRISFAENHYWCVQQNLNQYHFLFKKKSQYLETFKGVVTNINIFYKNMYILGKHFETNYNKNSF